MACDDPVDINALVGKPCVAGLDLSQDDRYDLFGGVLAREWRRASLLLAAG